MVPVLVPETVLLVPAGYQGLYSYITITMDMGDLLPLDTMGTALVMALVIMDFNHKAVRVRVYMALAALVLLDMDMVLVLILVRALDPVLMNSIHRGL